MNKQKGFTLIELLVVIAIISILSSIVFASLSSSREKANNVTAKVQAKEIQKAIELSRLNSSSFSLPQNIDGSKTIKTIVEETGTSPLKEAIEEFYSGDIPDIPSTVGGGDNDYYYISNGSEAIDDDDFEYVCGLASGVNTVATPDESVTFYRDKNTRGYYVGSEGVDYSLMNNTLVAVHNNEADFGYGFGVRSSYFGKGH